MLRYILFDLDGTLTDPGVGITNSVAYALNRFSIYPASREELYPYIGPPLTQSFQKYHKLTASQADEALALYREYFSVNGLFENEVYEGIAGMLESLRAAGTSLIIATSKPEEYTVRILERFKLDTYFDFVGGNTLDEKRPTKGSVIAYIREQISDISPENTVMVGDRKYDMSGAREHGLRGIGVLYGYGSRQELEDAGAAFIAKSVEELGSLLQALM